MFAPPSHKKRVPDTKVFVSGSKQMTHHETQALLNRCCNIGLLTWQDGSNKGTIDLFLFKKELKDYMLGPALELQGFQTDAKETMRITAPSTDQWTSTGRAMWISPSQVHGKKHHSLRKPS
eukprot:384133-Amphidinium_carterae.3